MKRFKFLFVVCGILLIFCGQAWGVAVDAWWDANYQYRKKFSCGNHDAYTSNKFLKVTGVDVTGAKFMDNGNDIRIVFQDLTEQLDLDRHLIGANTSSAEIYWKVQAFGAVPAIPTDEDIGGESDYKYYMYYGYSSAGSPGTYTNVDCIDAPYSTDGNTVALWHGEEASGTVYDETANDNDGTQVGGVTYEATGKFGKCLEYDGTDDYVWVDWYVADPPPDAITIDFWVYVDRDSQTIVSFNEKHQPSPASAWDRGFAVDSTSRVLWKVYDGNTYVCTSATELSTGTWYHVAGVIDESIGADSGLILYINGVAEDTTRGVDGGYMGYSTVEFLMGYNYAGGYGLAYDPFMYFDGKIDEICISNVTRTHFYHVVNEATLTLGAEEEGEVAVSPRRKKMELIRQ